MTTLRTVPLLPHPMRLLLLLFCSVAASATETDQFTTPPAPLRDIGPALSRKIVAIVESDRTGEDPERVLAKWAGGNLFASRIAKWVHELPDDEGPVRFRPSVFDSIYHLAFSPVPASFWFDSPTVNVHGYYMGTDKIDHFFRQGYDYFQVASKKGVKAAVAHGIRQEHKQLGTWTSGVYSNADLAANYAGMKFYLNLQNPVKIGDRTLPPLFERTNAGWRLHQGIDPARLLEPYVSNHFDESLNPSRYRFSRGSIRSRIAERCATWENFYGERTALAQQNFARDWFGEDYGHWLPPEDEVSIATACEASAP